jgi:hypothetical protein
MNRRDFLVASVAAAATADAAPQLAMNGGAPVRSKPLAGPNWGPQYYDNKEQTQLTEVLEGHNPFRFSNPPERSKVARFENECAARMLTKYALAVTSGTAALHTAMAALEVGPRSPVGFELNSAGAFLNCSIFLKTSFTRADVSAVNSKVPTASGSNTDWGCVCFATREASLTAFCESSSDSPTRLASLFNRDQICSSALN